MNMGADEFSSYFMAIPNIEAQEALLSMTISSYPHLKDTERKRIYRQMRKLANPFEKKDNIKMGGKQLQKFLAKNVV